MRLDDYLRRNILHAKAVGCFANAQRARERLQRQKRPPKWLVEALTGIIDRANDVAAEMRVHRDEAA